MQTKNEVLAIETWPVDRPMPYLGNPRTIPSSAVSKVAGSIKAYGWRQPIVVDRDGVVIVGHTRLLAAKHLGLATVPVHVALDMTPAQASAYRLADNRTGEETRWNPADLMSELAALGEAGMDLLAAGFDPTELPDYVPAFEAMADGDVKPLDQTAGPVVCCPACAHQWRP